MKYIVAIGSILFSFLANAQEPLSREQQYENEAQIEDVIDDDSYQLDEEQAIKNRLNINECSRDDLLSLHMLTDLQIDNFLQYRQLLGKFISIYELQAVPTFDIPAIRKLLPFVKLPGKQDLITGRDYVNGTHAIVFRAGRNLEKSLGFTTTNTNHYLGDPNRLFLRYGFNNGKNIQYGFTAEKDAGEPFFTNKQKYGFDFYSVHFFAKKSGIFDAIALGDFSVNMGQGLIQWQALAFKKSVDVMAIKRQGPVLKPYRSVGEYQFLRGAGVTLGLSRLKLTAFVSYKPVSGNFVADSTIGYISSLSTSGYYRTPSELADRYNVRQTAIGSVVKYATNRFHVAFNAIQFWFNMPLQKDDKAYNIYSINGRSWVNLSTDFSYTYRNVHVFGEAAMDKKSSKAVVAGALASVDRTVDLSLLVRSIAKSYQTLYGNAFTENVLPSNENGVYVGVAIKPVYKWRLDMYADLFSFPWLRYRVDAPSFGKEFLVQCTYKPSKRTEAYVRYLFSNKTLNEDMGIYNMVRQYSRQNIRFQAQRLISTNLLIRGRIETIYYSFLQNKETGYLLFTDALYRPVKSPFDLTGRILYYNTSSYNTRLYTYENDVLYSYAIPFYYGKGLRTYLMCRYNISPKVSIWLRAGVLLKTDSVPVGSGLDEIPGHHRTDLKAQIRFLFN